MTTWRSTTAIAKSVSNARLRDLRVRPRASKL
eukprot:CAMPEP_0119529602 /NCGR_PEP_ID=MMETSP1344-20130328/43589_1 /TAXON_ID=236787 /ORGANISM="Florenciella parvula, Strain CCMP2471" /LENGTH=31 /DNA_ID= /DNA_START= /DNA_END= /DNA_ORIENTATION=